MNLIENKIDEIKTNLLELVELYKKANTKLSENNSPSTIVRMTIVDKEKIEQMLHNTFGENLVYTDEYAIKKHAKLIDNYLVD